MSYPNPKRAILYAALASTSLLIPISAASADVFDANVTPTKTVGGPFISGTGVPADGFTINTAPTGESVALKGRQRSNGEPLGEIGNTYYVPAGLDGSNPAWTFDYQFSPGDSGLAASQYILTLSVDFDPGYNSTNFATISEPITGATPNWSQSDGYFTNPGSGGWSDNNVPFVVANNWNLGFTFWTQAPFNETYNPNTLGQYEVDLSVATVSAPDVPIASTSILVDVVPEPASIGMLAAGSILLLNRRRRGV